MKLVEIMRGSEHAFYQFISMHTDKNYFAPLAKLIDKRTVLNQKYGQVEKTDMGVYIDIFILDGLPDEPKAQMKIFKRSEHLRFLWGLSVRKLNSKSRNIFIALIKTIISIPFKLIGFRYYLKRLDRYSSRYGFDTSDYAGVICFGEGSREIMAKEDLIPVKSMEFEGYQFNCPSNERKYLTQMYGDYMKIPPESDRKIHKSMIYIKDQYALKDILQ